MKISGKLSLALALAFSTPLCIAATNIAYCPSDNDNYSTYDWQNNIPAGWNINILPLNDFTPPDTTETMQHGLYTFTFAEFFQGSNRIRCYYSMKGTDPSDPSKTKYYSFQLEKFVSGIEGEIKFVPLNATVAGWRMVNNPSPEQRKYGAVQCYAGQGETDLKLKVTDCPFK